MERYLNYVSLFSFHLLLFTLFIHNPTATSTNTTFEDDDGLCALVYCGQGTCKNSNNTLLPGFECECYSGWKKIEIGPVTFPSCLIPNCTVDVQCGNGSPPPPPPSAPVPPRPLNLTNPCNLIWCGDGTCMPNGTGHTCQCSEGSANLANNKELPCFQECYFGADCHGLGLGMPISTPPPPSSNSGSKGSSKASSVGELIVTLLAAASLTLL
ncbi:hypothetical protein JCGZ_06226 [Jatropha curcas]|uniref:EGF-like domain-containing protein n=1 Tax=Jatropha curcas TaxID=180498 RepID=A0A067KY33_JATCU|nr:uncharacterized protein LOC105635075 isoform X2 [Jatropha curcas]KDP37170.1 hypothetical protein JCGZ_06226 [Jatropha curcas]